jgi:hypothetical protein
MAIIMPVIQLAAEFGRLIGRIDRAQYYVSADHQER